MWLPRFTCSTPGHPGPEGADRHGSQNGKRDHDGPGQEFKAQTYNCSASAGHVGLALAADVEKAGMEGNGNRKAGEDEVGGVVEKIAPALERAHGALEHDPHGFQRIFANDQHHQAGDHQGEQQIEKRDQGHVNPDRKLAARAAIRPHPLKRRP